MKEPEPNGTGCRLWHNVDLEPACGLRIGCDQRLRRKSEQKCSKGVSKYDGKSHASRALDVFGLRGGGFAFAGGSAFALIRLRPHGRAPACSEAELRGAVGTYFPSSR